MESRKIAHKLPLIEVVVVDVTLEDINILCKRHHLECTLIWNDKYTSLNCEIYKVVNEKNFCNAIRKIMDLAEDAIRYTKRR